MRAAVIAAVVVLVATASARAEQAADFTTVYGAPGEFDDEPRTIVPAYPSLFVVLGADGPQDMPVFSTGDGAHIAIRHVTSLSTYPHSIVRVDLDVFDGEIMVRLPGDDRPIASYVIDPTFRPRTRSVSARPTGMALSVSSDAVAFRILGRGRNTVQFNDGHVFVEAGKQQRVLALYPNGTEEVIYDGVPRAPREEPEARQLVPEVRLRAMDLSPLPATLLLLLVLGLVGVLAARIDE